MRKNAMLILDVLTNRQVKRMPVWLMRQAGRFLPEYRQIRKQAPDFISFCLSPDLATEVTLQPVRRFGMDAAILFADILLVPHALGQKVTFVEQSGPKLSPIRAETELKNLKWDSDILAPVYETISRVRKELEGTQALLGFSGGLWTVACYMIEGSGREGFAQAVSAAKNGGSFMDQLMDQLHDATLEYLGRQIEAGVNAIQLFDSHAGLLDGPCFNRYVTEPTRKLVAAIKAEYPDIPVIGFPRGATEQQLLDYAARTGVDCLGLDQRANLDYAARELRGILPLQGNLDPALLLEGGSNMLKAADDLFHRFGPNHIFNLGHGVIKETPPEHVKELVDHVRSLS